MTPSDITGQPAAGSNTAGLPNYDRPPVIEVAVGVQFRHWTSLQQAHVGLFWQRLAVEYPNVEERAPTPASFEDLSTTKPALEFGLRGVPPLRRTFFVSSDGQWLVQVQEDRLFQNWRRPQPGSDKPDYPRFPACLDRFFRTWGTFLKFCDDAQLERPQIDQLEVTYINHVPAGDAWKTLDDVGAVFPDITWRRTHPRLRTPEGLTWKAAFRLAEDDGRLHASVTHALRVSDQQPVLLCEMMARGMPRDASDAGMRDWFLRGRHAIVTGFEDLTSDEVQRKLWGKR